jgi:predicted RNase H-like HicB family nuclease
LKSDKNKNMRTIEYTFWQDGEFFIGYLNEFPDYQTQGFSKEELMENLKDILFDIETREIPYIKKVEKLVVA